MPAKKTNTTAQSRSRAWPAPRENSRYPPYGMALSQLHVGGATLLLWRIYPRDSWLKRNAARPLPQKAAYISRACNS